MPQIRRHAAIMFTDIVGYTRLMGSDEEKAVDMLSRNRSIHQSSIEKFNGTLIKEIGDGVLASFLLASEAVRCAMEIQKECKEQGIPLKIGIHEGETIFSGSDVIGDGVNIASRLEGRCPGGLYQYFGKVYSEHKKSSSEFMQSSLGDKEFKNVDDPVKVYKILCENERQNPQKDKTHKSNSKILKVKLSRCFSGGLCCCSSIFYNLAIFPSKGNHIPG